MRRRTLISAAIATAVIFGTSACGLDAGSVAVPVPRPLRSTPPARKLSPMASSRSSRLSTLR